jgi:beta-fructofuranosidase
VADNPRGPFHAPEDEALGGRRWYAAKSSPSPDGRGRIFFGWVHEITENGRWCWGGDFAAAREVVTTSEGALRVRLPDAVRSAFRFPVALDGQETPVVDLPAPGTSAAHGFDLAPVPDAYLAQFEFSFDEAPAAFGVSLRTDDDLAGWFVAFDRSRGTVNLSRRPHPLDDFWADLVGRGHERRDVDGPFVAEARLELPRASGRVACTLLVEGSVVEIYVDDRLALTHRGRRAVEHQRVEHQRARSVRRRWRHPLSRVREDPLTCTHAADP